VSKKFFRPPNLIIKEWPEVFEDMYMSTMPLYYTKSLFIKFDDGRIWHLDIQDMLKDYDTDTLAKKLTDTIKEYQKEIKSIDFEINIDQLKTDVNDSTKNIL